MKKIVLLFAVLGLNACATVTSGTTQDIVVHTDIACIAQRGEQQATVTPEWHVLKVSKSSADITLTCGNKPPTTIKSEATTAGLVSVWLIDGGLVDMATGAMWSYPSEVQP